MDSTESSQYLFKKACDTCGSSDARAVYSDGHEYCFSCQDKSFSEKRGSNKVMTKVNHKELLTFEANQGRYSPLSKRSLTKETCEHYGYWIGTLNDGRIVQVANYRDINGEIIAQKVRDADKNFFCTGKLKAGNLFGQHLYSKGKIIVITEGEIDCMVVSQLQGNKYPVVSLPEGASSARKSMAAAYEYLDNFEKIVLMFDMDKAGREATEAAAEVLPVGKVYVAVLPFKDADECVRNGRAEDVKSQIWNANKWAPETVVRPYDLKEEVRKAMESAITNDTPFMDYTGLTEATGGIQGGQVIMLTSGSGMGKSTFGRQLVLWLLQHAPHIKPAAIMLEESNSDTIQDLMGLSNNVRLRQSKELQEEILKDGRYDEWYDKLFKDSRLVLFRGFAEGDRTKLLNSMRYMVTVEGSNLILLDHISIVASASAESDERKMLDSFMTELKEFAKRYDVAVVTICHLKNPEKGKPYNEGRPIRITDLRGSGSLYQLSDTIIGFERNQQGDNPNYVQIRLLKARLMGTTGLVDSGYFNKTTGWLEHQGLASDEQPVFSDEDIEQDF